MNIDNTASTFRLRPLQFRYQGQGELIAVAFGATYTLEVRDNGRFQAYIGRENLGTDTLENCFTRCQRHLENAVADLIDPASHMAA